MSADDRGRIPSKNTKRRSSCVVVPHSTSRSASGGGTMRMRVVFSVLVFGSVTAMLISHIGKPRHVKTGGSAPNPNSDPEVAQIWKDYGVSVHLKYDRNDFFCEDWKSPPISAQGTQIEPDEATHVKRLVPRFLAMYPRSLIREHLHSIYFLKTLKIYGRWYAGTYSEATLYIAARRVDFQHDDKFWAAVMHSEFSSILYHVGCSPFFGPLEMGVR
jgi:hypothetical protein